MSDAVIYDHLAGERTVGVYPLLSDDTCHFLAADFDDADWREDALAFVQSCHELGVPAALEISRSGNGAHVWIFFADSVPARDARRLGTAVISHTCARKRQLKLGSYDRLFPNLPLVLHGRMSKKQRAALIMQLEALAPDAPRILLATGKLVGEGFDHPPLDTLVLAMPISWKGTLQQYAGRLHREHATKTDVRIIDFVDTGHPALLRMWDKRQRGYQAMGYRMSEKFALSGQAVSQ
ncbi:MAG: hypothetical protein ABIO35_02690 [Nitrobacter sp.]